jgi:hypothetical protein
MEALDQLTNLNKHSHKEYKVKCDLQISEKCRKEYLIEYRRIFKVLKENKNNIVCLYCSRTSKFSGRNNPNTKYLNLNDEYFSVIDSNDKAYILGWIASDGHIGKRGFKISINQKDIEILNFIANNICKEIPIRKFTTPTSKMCSYEINSKQISKDLCKILQINPGKKSDKIKFPLISNKFYWDFIRGYFDGDGSVNDPNISKYPYIKGNIHSNSNNMLLGIKRAIGNIGQISCDMLCLSNKQMMHFMEQMYKNGGPKLERKFIRYSNWKNESEK